MRVLDLFSGIGGISLGLERAGMTTAAFCEIEKHLHPILAHHFPGARIFDDIRSISNDDLRCLGTIDIVAGGFPCQDISVAGKGVGLSGDRSGLWWEMRRIIAAAQPAWVLAENVPALRTRGADDVLLSLEKLGYTCEPVVVGADDAGAPHRRDRVWIVGYADCYRVRKQSGGSSGEDRTEAAITKGASLGDSDWAWQGVVTESTRKPVATITDPDVPDTDNSGLEGLRARAGSPGAKFPMPPGIHQHDWEEPRLLESKMGSSTHGLSRRLALKALGNSVVPQVVEAIGRAIMRIHNET